MDSSSSVWGAAGLFAGWIIRGWFRQDSPKCHCDCHCAHSYREKDSGYPGALTLLAFLVSLCLITATGFAWAFKVTVVKKGEEREVAVHLKGKSKGVYNPARALQITD